MGLVLLLVIVAVVLGAIALFTALKWIFIIAVVVLVLGAVRGALTRGNSR